MKDFTMVIPTYWKQAGASAEKVVFDHPTPLDETGTLGRLLDSLEIFDRVQGKIVIIAVANHPAIAGEVEDKIRRIIAPYSRSFDICILGEGTLEKVRRMLSAKGVSAKALSMINLDNYAGVRNICSLAGVLTGSRYTIFIDDDEVFCDRKFLEKIDENMERPYNGDTVKALAGYYLQPDTYRLDERAVPSWRKPHWNNTAVMNEAFDLFIGRGERLKAVPFVFGGNMTLCVDVLKRVPFDPRITRGEDIDFLLNLRINGITFYLDRELAIKHLPPGSAQPAWIKVREDGLRFLYERKKLLDHPQQLTLAELQPYPGLFLGDDLEERIIKTCELLKEEYESRQDEEGVRNCREIIAMVKENPFAAFDTRSWLAEITAGWQEITARAHGLGIPE
ncbi:MAG: hypothetical protein DRG82_14625 [Deltaproteobacteria bacterium]|nr:MAG: hypothetical protein DRG82_14625 [Deltaproteobacteria bacterium]